MATPKKQAMKVSTRPEDWAPAARAHLFGLHTLSPGEFAHEGTRMSAGRPAYGEAVYRAALRRKQAHRQA